MTIDVSQMSLGDLNRVITIVKHFLPPSYDTESIALDILMASWENDYPVPSQFYIKSRCLNILRDHKKELEIMERKSHEPNHPVDENPEAKSEVDKAIAVLDNRERKVIYYRFYADYTMEVIAAKMGLSLLVVRQLLQGALYKMRQEIEE